MVINGKVLVVAGIEKETSSSALSSTRNESVPDKYPSVSNISIKDLFESCQRVYSEEKANSFLNSIGYHIASRSETTRSDDNIKVVMPNVNSPARLSVCNDAKPDRERLLDASEAGMTDAEKRRKGLIIFPGFSKPPVV